MGYKLSIDFGTTNTVLACWNEAQASPEVVSLPGLCVEASSQQPPLAPSLVYVRDGQSGEVTIGQTVIEQGLTLQKGQRLFRNFKRGIVAMPAPDPREIDGAWWTDRLAGCAFIQRLIAAMPFRKDEIEQLVLTAPVASFEGYLGWLNDVMGDLSDKIRIVDESTAAALGYAVTEPEALVLVFDFGGGTLDLSLVQLPESTEQSGGLLRRLLKGHVSKYAARVISKAGRVIGGSDIDQWLLREVLRRTGLSLEELGHDYTPLLTVCEQAKIALSSAEFFDLKFEVAGKAYELTITRVELEALLEANGFYTTLRYVVDKVMHVAHRRSIYKEDINYVLLVGGVSLMPSVQRTLKEYFGDLAVRADKPFTAVAEGALQLAAGYGLEDYLVHGYGLRYLDPETGRHDYDEIVPMGSRYPIEHPIEVMLGAAHANQTEIELVIGEIDSDAVSTIEVKYEDGQAVFVAQADRGAEQIVPINAAEAAQGVVRLDPPGTPGEDRLRAEFSVDERRCLRVSVFDLLTQKESVHDARLADLSDRHQPSDPEVKQAGREPVVSTRGVKGKYRLSLRSLGTLLNALPPESISLEAAAAALRSKDFFVRYGAAVLLAKRGDRSARLILQDVIETGEPPARASAARELHGFSWFAVELIVHVALKDTDSRVREGAVYGLCDMRDPSAYRLLAEVLEHETDNVRAAAAWGLRDCQDVAAVPVLEAVLKAADPDVRVKGLEALGANQTALAIAVVRHALNDPDPDVQYAATLSWIELAGEACFQDLSTVIEQTCGTLRQQVLRGFFHATNYLQMNVLHSPAADRLIDVIGAALHDDAPKTRMQAVWPLAWIRHDRAPSLLDQAYRQESDSEVKAHIVRVAVNLMSPVGRGLLQDALHCGDEHIEEVARQIVHEHEHDRV